MPDASQLLPLFGLLILIGAFAGIVAGLLGVGGGIILVPAFLYTFLALGYDGPMVMQTCLATSLATIVFTSARSLSSHNKKGAVRWDICASGDRASPSARFWVCSPRAGSRRGC